uniref:Uncharacterized protein n=1 Tax=Arundo donax TaxID=35708 RepID=A0A0A8ZNJ1_ARUDO
MTPSTTKLASSTFAYTAGALL